MKFEEKITLDLFLGQLVVLLGRKTKEIIIIKFGRFLL